MAAFDYTTATNVFAYGNSAGTATDPVNEAAVMASLVTGYSRAVDQYCQQVFYQQIYADQEVRALVDQEGVLTCYPAAPTVGSITAASWRRARSSTWTSLITSQLDAEQRTYGSVVRVLDQTFAAYRGERLSMRLSYTGGWANLAAVPSDFEWMMRMLCWWGYQKRSAPQDKSAFPELGMVVVPGQNWPGHVKAALRNYVRQVPM